MNSTLRSPRFLDGLGGCCGSDLECFYPVSGSRRLDDF